MFGISTSIRSAIYISDSDVLYSALPQVNSISSINLKNKAEKILAADENMDWPNSLSFDHKGNLVITSNKVTNISPLLFAA